MPLPQFDQMKINRILIIFYSGIGMLGLLSKPLQAVENSTSVPSPNVLDEVEKELTRDCVIEPLLSADSLSPSGSKKNSLVHLVTGIVVILVISLWLLYQIYTIYDKYANSP